eukprot:scaffold5539_cov126-Isochrysis_galbana.AAC.3
MCESGQDAVATEPGRSHASDALPSCIVHCASHRGSPPVLCIVSLTEAPLRCCALCPSPRLPSGIVHCAPHRGATGWLALRSKPQWRSSTAVAAAMSLARSSGSSVAKAPSVFR